MPDVTGGQREAVNVKWDTKKVRGDTVELFVRSPDRGWLEVRSGKNDGAMTVTFPPGFKGKRDVVVVGSQGGIDDGEIVVK